MSRYISRDELIVAGVSLLCERTTITKAVALSTVRELAATVPSAPDWGDPGGKDKVRADAETPFLSALLDRYVHRRVGGDDVEDEVISFAAPEPTLAEQLAPLDKLLVELKAQDAEAARVARVQELINGAAALQQELASYVEKATRPAPAAAEACECATSPITFTVSNKRRR